MVGEEDVAMITILPSLQHFHVLRILKTSKCKIGIRQQAGVGACLRSVYTETWIKS